MRKNGSRLISYKQYCFTDLFLFALILTAFELIVHFAYKAYSGPFIFSPYLAIVLLVIMRWGWQSVFFAVGDGLLYCLLNLKSPGFENCHFAIYIIGNCAVCALLLMTKFWGRDKIAKKWYFTLVFVIAGWLSVVLGRSVVAACFGKNFLGAILDQLTDLLSLAIAIAIILVMLRLDGMFEYQKSYLLRLDKERKEKMRRDTFGDEPVEIDEESLNVLKKKDDDLY